MSTATETRHWDFSPVLDLQKSLSTKDSVKYDSATGFDSLGSNTSDGNASPGLSKVDRKDFAIQRPSGLGDFSKIFALFPTAASSVPTSSDEPSVPSRADYASDGATYIKTPKRKEKGVQYHFNTSGDEDLATDTVTDCSISPDTPSLTRTQRKKRNRKLRKAAEAAKVSKSAVVSESEAEITIRKTPTPLPAQRAGLHMVSAVPLKSSKATSLQQDLARSKVIASKAPETDVQLAVSRVAEQQKIIKSRQAVPVTPNKSIPKTQSHPQTAKNPTKPTDWPTYDSDTKPKRFPFAPASVKPDRKLPIAPHKQSNQSDGKDFYEIHPLLHRSPEDQHYALFLKLINNFTEDRKYLISPMNLTTHNNSPNGIHIFVDASNIFIGFIEHMKIKRGVPKDGKTNHINISFDALALLMERRRPVAKRFMAGSNKGGNSHFEAAFNKAEAVGYECKRLEQVCKLREVNENKGSSPNKWETYNSHNGAKASFANRLANGSGSETTAPTFIMRDGEQGVDEILHLRMTMSILDYDEPTTIVLATGDANVAEYSDGFLAMVMRALKKGWKVELLSWKKSVHHLYKELARDPDWRKQFKVLYLDDYAEELLAIE